MNIIYLAGCYSKTLMKWCHSNIDGFRQLPGVKFHRLMAEGLLENGISGMYFMSALPFINKRLVYPIIDNMEVEDGITYFYSPVIDKSLKLITDYSFFCKKIQDIYEIDDNCVIICDILNAASSLSALKMAKRLGVRCYAIVTDLPNYVIEERTIKNIVAGYISNFLAVKYVGYILLTEYMNRVINPKNKPYVVTECLVDSHYTLSKYDICKKKKCMYAGGVFEKYGIPEMIEGFIEAQIPELELHIFGDGDYVKEMNLDFLRENNVFYRGVVSNEKILHEECESILLINPRSPYEEFSKYSFPSKNMEYMTTGTAMMGFKLPGIPNEFFDHMFVIDEFSSKSIAQTLKNIFSLPMESIKAKGLNAQQFVLREKTNVIMAKKILELFESS